MEFSANNTFYHYNEQWVWFGWSDGHGGSPGALPVSVQYQESLKDWHLAGQRNPELLTPYYNLGFNAVQPYADALPAARVDDMGYKLYGNYNAKNYLRRFTLNVKSLNFAQWEYDPKAEKDVHTLSDTYQDNTVGQKVRKITNNGGGRAGWYLEDELGDPKTRELTLLDLNTQDLYYKEGEGIHQSDGACISLWDNPGIGVWDPWPQQNRTYGLGQYGGQEVPPCPTEPKFKRYASPVKGAPARIRRIPIYQKVVKDTPDPEYNEGKHVAADQSESDGDEYPLWVADECGNVSIPQKSKDYYSDAYGVNFNEALLNKIFESVGGIQQCGGCLSEGPEVVYKTGYYYSLSTAPVMAPATSGTPSENGLGWDPGYGITEAWAPSGGYGIVVEKLNCNSCLPNIKDVVTKTYAGNTSQTGQGPCKVLELDMGLYEIDGNHTTGRTVYREVDGSYEKVQDTQVSNLWIGPPKTGACEVFEKGIKSGDCNIITSARPVKDDDGNVTWIHEKTVSEIMEAYSLIESGYDAACKRNREDEFFKVDSYGPIENIEEEGKVVLNLREIRGTGCLQVFKGEDLFTGANDCDGRNYLYISGGCGSGSGLNVTGTGCVDTFRVGDTIYISGHCPSGTGNLTGVQNITGTGCVDTFRVGDTIYISGHCPSGTGNLTGVQNITGTGCVDTFRVGDTIYISGHCPSGTGNLTGVQNITGTGCVDTFRVGDTIYISGHCPSGTGNLTGVQNITGTGCVDTFRVGDTIYISGHCPSGTGNLTGVQNITGTGCVDTFRVGDTIYISGHCPSGTGNLTGVQNITGTGCVDTFRVGDTIYISGHCSTKTGNLTGVQSITGTGCVDTFRVGDTIYISGHCPSGTGNLTGVQNITGTGCVDTFRVGDTIYISGHCSTKTGNLTGVQNITGDGCCIETKKVGDTIYISNSCNPTLTGNFPHQEGTGVLPTHQSNLIKDYYFVTGDNGESLCTNYVEFHSITGTGCIQTFSLEDNIYISGGSAITGARDSNFDFSEVGKVYSGISTGTCGDELVFRQITGRNCIIVDTFEDAVEIRTEMSFSHGTSNLWYTPLGEYGITTTDGESFARTNGDDGDCEFVWNLKSITGAGCVDTFEQDDTIYISGQDCFPEGGSSCDVLIGPGDSPSWKDTEDLILECLGLSWKKVTMCEDDGSTACYEILAREVSCTTTVTPTVTSTTDTSSPPATTPSPLPSVGDTTTPAPGLGGEVEYNYAGWQKFENMGITYGGQTWLEGLGPTGYHYDQSTYGRRGTDFVYNCSFNDCPKTGADFRIDYADFSCPEAAEREMWTFYANNGPQPGSYWNTDAETFRSINTYEKLFSQYAGAFNNVSFITADPATKGGNFTGFTGEGIGFKFEDISNVDPNDGNAYTYNGHGFYLGIGTSVPPGHTLHQWTGEDLLATLYPHTGYNWYIKSGPGARQMWIRSLEYGERLALEEYSSDDQGFVSVTTVDPCSHLVTTPSPFVTTTIIPTSTTSAP